MGETSDTSQEPKRKRVDLSVPQVAGSAVAAVVAARLASYFGVYGTILGAGVVSAIATCGGTVFQHFFSRTGEQIREVKVQGRPKRATGSRPRRPEPAEPTAPAHEFGAGTVHRARVTGWKRPLVAAALVFGVTMAGITTYELVSGDNFSGSAGTTVGDALSGHHGKPSPDRTPSPDPSRSPSPADSGTPDDGVPSPGGDGDTGWSPTPTPAPTRSPDPGDAATDDGSGAGTPAPAPSSGATTAPAPGASSRSRTVVPGPDGLSER